MAIYHLSVKPVQRSRGQSATASAAYRAGDRIRCEREGRNHDYSRKNGVDHCEIVGWSGDRSALWNAAEQAERRKDATVAREYEVALPVELNREQQIELTRNFAKELNERHNVAVDIAIHNSESENPHAHILTTTRPVNNEDGLSSEKATIEWSDKKRKQHGLPTRKAELERMRASWSEHTNNALQAADIDERVDHRSFKDRNIERTPTIKEGPVAAAMRRRGKQSNRSELRAQSEQVQRIEVERDKLLQESTQPAPQPQPASIGQALGSRLRQLNRDTLEQHQPTPQRRERMSKSKFEEFCERYNLDQNSVEAEAEFIESRRQLERLTRAADANESLEREQPQINRDALNRFVDDQKQTQRLTQNNDSKLNRDALNRFVQQPEQQQPERGNDSDDDTGPRPAG